jgi:hypothetical protein
MLSFLPGDRLTAPSSPEPLRFAAPLELAAFAEHDNSVALSQSREPDLTEHDMQHIVDSTGRIVCPDGFATATLVGSDDQILTARHVLFDDNRDQLRKTIDDEPSANFSRCYFATLAHPNVRVGLRLDGDGGVGLDRAVGAKALILGSRNLQPAFDYMVVKLRAPIHNGVRPYQVLSKLDLHGCDGQKQCQYLFNVMVDARRIPPSVRRKSKSDPIVQSAPIRNVYESAGPTVVRSDLSSEFGYSGSICFLKGDDGHFLRDDDGELIPVAIVTSMMNAVDGKAYSFQSGGRRLYGDETTCDSCPGQGSKFTDSIAIDGQVSRAVLEIAGNSRD